MTYEEWETEGEKRFGKDRKMWKFKCPVCGYVASAQDYLDVGAEDGIAFSCIGRWMDKKRDMMTVSKKSKSKSPCNYAGGGLFRLNPLKVIDKNDDGTEEIHDLFAFAD